MKEIEDLIRELVPVQKKVKLDYRPPVLKPKPSGLGIQGKTYDYPWENLRKGSEIIVRIDAFPYVQKEVSRTGQRLGRKFKTKIQVDNVIIRRIK